MRAAQHNEFEEWDEVYKSFGKIAREEGFTAIAQVFEGVARIEKAHADRFGRLADEIENGTIFRRDEEIAWMCTVCGNIHVGKEVPEVCNVCRHPQDSSCPLRNLLLRSSKKETGEPSPCFPYVRKEIVPRNICNPSQGWDFSF